VYTKEMELEWWEPKRFAVLDARGLDFLDGRRLFDGRTILTAPSPVAARNGGSASGSSTTK